MNGLLRFGVVVYHYLHPVFKKKVLQGDSNIHLKVVFKFYNNKYNNTLYTYYDGYSQCNRDFIWSRLPQKLQRLKTLETIKTVQDFISLGWNDSRTWRALLALWTSTTVSSSDWRLGTDGTCPVSWQRLK